jgi:hypothetical protein
VPTNEQDVPGTVSTAPDLSAQVVARYVEINGRHPMTAEDDAYVDRHYRTLEALCADRAETPDEVRAEMLAGRLPLPGYLRSDGTPMFPADYFRLVDDAGGVDRLATWFHRHWSDADHAAEEWDSYLSGQYVCLSETTPGLMRRKDELAAEIRSALAVPEPGSDEWLDHLHALVDELDAQTVEFTAYDRLRFGGPVSRDSLITDVRAAHPRRNTGEGS